MLASLENLPDHRPEQKLMIRKLKILKEGCPQTNQTTEGKNPDIKFQILKRNILLCRPQRKNSGQHSGGGGEGGGIRARAMGKSNMEYLRKSTTSVVRRTCKSLERKVTQAQNDFLLHKHQQEKQSTDFKQSLDYTSEQIESLQREKADLKRKANGSKKDLEEQIDNIKQYSRRQCIVFIWDRGKREEILIRTFCNFAEITSE